MNIPDYLSDNELQGWVMLKGNADESLPSSYVNEYAGTEYFEHAEYS